LNNDSRLQKVRRDHCSRLRPAASGFLSRYRFQ
jgi:hypothetical protein